MPESKQYFNDAKENRVYELSYHSQTVKKAVHIAISLDIRVSSQYKEAELL